MEQLECNDGKLLDLETSLIAKVAEIERLNSVVDSQASSITSLKLTMNESEQYSRRNCLKFYGVKESASEDTDKIVCQLATERLGVPVTIADIDRSHRVASRNVGATDSQTSNDRAKKPRTIIAKFCSYRVRTAVLRARRKLKGSGIGIDEALTSTNQELLQTAKKHAKVKEAWSSDGRIVVLLPASQGKTMKRTIHSKNDLANL